MSGTLRDRRLGIGRLSFAKQKVSIQYVANKLPSVPSDRQFAVVDAVNTSASGQPYSAESVVDILALSQGLWVLMPGNQSCFQDSAGTTIANVNEPVGLVRSWSGANNFTQGTTATKPTLTAAGSNFVTDDRLFFVTPNGLKAADPKTTFWALKTNASTRYDFYGTRVNEGGINNAGTGYSLILNTGAAGDFSYASIGGGAVTASGAFTNLQNMILRSQTGASGATTSLFVNGNQRGTTNNIVSGAAEITGGYSALGFQNGTAQALNGVVMMGATFSSLLSATDSLKVERFINAFTGIGVL